MRTLREWLHRLVATRRPGRRADDLQEELRLHIELATAGGKRIVGTAQAMDALRDQRGLPWLEQTAADMQQAFRALSARGLPLSLLPTSPWAPEYSASSGCLPTQFIWCAFPVAAKRNERFVPILCDSLVIDSP